MQTAFPDADLLAQTLTEGWIEVVDTQQDEWKPLKPGVDPGEASAIQKACLWSGAGDAVLLVTDDRAYFIGRSVIAAVLAVVGE